MGHSTRHDNNSRKAINAWKNGGNAVSGALGHAIPGVFQRYRLPVVVFSFVATMAIEATSNREYLNALAGILFAAPFVLFSPMGGFLADRFSKRSVILGTKFGEMPSWDCARWNGTGQPSDHAPRVVSARHSKLLL